MNIKPDSTKFTDRDLDEFIHRIYNNMRSKPYDTYVFDLSDVERIGNQELLVLSALFKSFVESKVNFKVLFFKPGVPLWELNNRIKRQIIQFWDVWHLWSIVPSDECRDIFGIDEKYVQALKMEIDYYPKKEPEIFNRFEVTPFISLNYVNNYNEIDVEKRIRPIYKLNSAIEELLKISKCHHPFTSNALSTIVTEELYLNFLDHSIQPSFKDFPLMAFMSISFHRKMENRSDKEIQNIKQLNFESECLEETKNFFYDKETKRYKNQHYIEFSFLDFGKGIVNTLKDQFLIQNKFSKEVDFDSQILEYSFKHNSSRHPIYDAENKVDKFIPRGLFDVLTIVKRYKGLLIARSNFGKTLFDFSDESDINEASKNFGNKDLFFPGTLISIYIPAIEDDTKIDISSIKPEIVFRKVKPEKKKYVNVNTIVENLKGTKEDLYYDLQKSLRNEIIDLNGHSLVFISFKGCTIEKRLIKKIIYFLLTDYEINYRNNVVILNSPPENIIDDIASEILNINFALRNYKLHPLPIIDFDENNEDLNIKWLGIYNDEDKEKLNDLLYEDYSITKSDFNDPNNVLGHLNAFDSYGNLISNFPNKTNIIEFYRIENANLTSNQVTGLLLKHGCIKNDDNKNLYLCSGNYYQREYVELNDLVNDKNDCTIISKLLYDKIKFEVKNLTELKFVSISLNSYKLLKSLELQGEITNSDYVSFDNYISLEKKIEEKNFDTTKKYILVCDVISTGHLTEKLGQLFKELGTTVEYIAVVVSTLDKNFKPTKAFLKNYENKILFLFQYPITKLKLTQNTSLDKMLSKEILSKETIRINPYTNIPIRLSIEETNFNESIVFPSKISYVEDQNEIIIQNEFLDNVDKDAIYVGFLEYNNVIHPYFFDTEKILREIKDDLLEAIFKAIGKSEFNTEKIKVFYPRKSGIDSFRFDQLKLILNNQAIEETEIERFGTSEGWRFPHNSDYLNTKIENNFCFIIDDGSCSGDSLIQMIDEISFYDVREIVLLCIIGRIKDHKREFFSRLSNIKVKKGKVIPISIYFVSHWHLPTYYLDENPNIRETAWLNDIINLQNTPQSLKVIAQSVKKAIAPKKKEGFVNHKYLPKTRDENVIPKKELLTVRSELGKVIGYRLYKESFTFFDYFIKKYEKKELTNNRYKEIELLCATFIYEPYLYTRISGSLPDVVGQLERFVQVLIFSNQRIYEKLTYSWSKKDIIHLFFIVFKDKDLINELTIEKFKQLIEFTKEGVSTTNYILYKLLLYFPITRQQFNEKKFDAQIKELIFELKSDKSLPENSNREIRKFYNFITSLPSRDDFDSQLADLRDNYEKQREPEFHDQSKSFNHNVTALMVVVHDIILKIRRGEDIEELKIDLIRKSWFKMLEFIKPILIFSSSFEEFFLPYTSYELVNQLSSLRKMVGDLDEIVLSSDETLKDLNKLARIREYVSKIQSNFQLNSTFCDVVEHPKSNLLELISLLKSSLEKFFRISETGTLPPIERSKINIPKVYMEKLLVAELVTNMEKYSVNNDSKHIKFRYDLINNNEFCLVITNEAKKSEIGNSEGTKCLKHMSDSPIFGFNYSSSKRDNNYTQTFIFKLN